MIHPDTQVKLVRPEIGYGVFATDHIPLGTIVYAQDALDIVITEDSPLLGDSSYGPIIRKYAITEPGGERVLCWDIAKFVNHCCKFNTISTGYGFEVAVRDIEPGEELTDEYALFNLDEEFPLICHHSDCRGRVCAEDIDAYAHQWDASIQAALQQLQSVPQPLWKYIEPATQAAVIQYLDTGVGYKSVRALKHVTKGSI